MSVWQTNVKRVTIPNRPDAEEYVREISASELDEFKTVFNDDASELDNMIETCVICCCDKDGNRKFTQNDVDMLRSAPLNTIQACATAAMVINGFMTEDEEREDLTTGQ